MKRSTDHHAAILWRDVVSAPTTTQKKPAIGWGKTEKEPGGINFHAAQTEVIEDAFDHTHFAPGEKVAFCTYDKVAYHLSTWEFLQSKNEGKCCICGKTNVIQVITLPEKAPAISPKPAFQASPLQTSLIEEVISLEEVQNHIGLAVVVQDYVYEVYKTRASSTYFVRFESRDLGEPPFQGFKVVIFQNYLPLWESAGVSIENYEDKTIRVRGIVQQHPTYGVEILVNSPAMIEVVN